MGPGHDPRVAYTYADQSGTASPGARDLNTCQVRTETGYDFNNGVFIGESLDLGLDHPDNVDHPASWHRDHNFVASWTWLVPRTLWRNNAGLMVSGIYRWMSGRPFEMLAESRMDNNNRELAPPGSYSAEPDSDIGATDVEFDGKENGAEGPDFTKLDLSARYRIAIGASYDLTVMVDAFNLTNAVNFISFGNGRVARASFLIPGSAFLPRQIQFGFRFAF